ATACNGEKGNTITATLTPYATLFRSSAMTSPSVTVADTAPVINSVKITPSSPTTNQVLTANVTSHDDDGDTVRYTYQWFKNGTTASGQTSSMQTPATPVSRDQRNSIT